MEIRRRKGVCRVVNLIYTECASRENRLFKRNDIYINAPDDVTDVFLLRLLKSTEKSDTENRHTYVARHEQRKGKRGRRKDVIFTGYYDKLA